MLLMMDSSKPAMLRIISSAIVVATRAGAEVRQITKTGKLGIVDKGVHDYQTEADRRAQRMIVVSMAKRFPKSTIVGEEDLVADKKADASLLVEDFDESVLSQTLPKEYESVKEEDVTIWVDPLDGTSEFVKGVSYEHVTVLIGISVNGKSVAGVINQPFYEQKDNDEDSTAGRTMWGLVGLGCFGITPKSMSSDDFVITTTASHGNENIEQSIASLKPDKVLKVGGAGHKVLLVLEGKAHSYLFASAGCKRWDTCAPEAILRSAGGHLTDAFGETIEYKFRLDGNYQNYLGVIASANSEIHSKVIESIPKEVRDRLKSKSKL